MSRRGYFRVECGGKVLARQTHSQAADVPLKLSPIVRHGGSAGSRVAEVVPGDGLEQEGGVFDIFGHRADLVERRGVGYESVARDAAVGGLEANDAAVAGRLAHRAAGV